MHPDGLVLIGPLGVRTLRAAQWGRDVVAVGGLTLGADPIAYAMSYASRANGSAGAAAPLRAFTVRKALKAHGTGKLVEGPLEAGDRVAIVEDVITTGGSALRAADAARAVGAVVAGVLALVDREEGGREAIEASGLPVISLTRASEILAQMEST
jgi:orotate phosphoribosyltransferase